MASIEEKVVSMRFDNSRFQGAVSATLGALQKLEQALKMDKASKGFKDIGAAAKTVDINDLATKVDNLAAKFTGVHGIGTGALLAIGSAAVQMGQKISQSLTQSVTSGFGEYETKIGSIQTILANTRKHGTDLEAVSKALGGLNEYADKTIYSFGDMTRNIGLFTNAGLKLEESTSMIKGFSNEAAASGTTAAGAANAAYQLSQALSAGQIRLMDWRSLTNVGMGNDNMKNGLLDIAKAMKTIDAETAASAQKDFNGSLEKGWLTADVMSKYLQIMAKDMDASAMKALGLSDAQIENFTTQAQIAEEAATKVRTFTQLVGTLAEAAGSGWATTFELLLGDFNEATELFSGINDVLGGMVNASTKARNDMVRAFVDAGGRDAIIRGFQNIYSAIVAVFKPIGDAFKSIFPPSTGNILLTLANGFESLTSKLKVTESVAKVIAGVFTVVALVLKTLGNVAMFVIGGFIEYGKVFGALFNLLSKIVAPIMDITAALFGLGEGGSKTIDNLFGFFSKLRTEGADRLVEAIDKVAESLGGWEDATQGVEDWIRKTDLLAKAAEWLLGVWEQVKGIYSQVAAAMPGVLAAASEFLSQIPGHLEGFGSMFMDIYGKIKQWFADMGGDASDFGTKARDAVKGFVEFLKESLEGFDPMLLLSLLNTAVLFGVGKKIAEFFKTGGGIKDSLIGTLESITGAFEALQKRLEPDKLKNIGVAILLIAAALAVLASIDPERLGSAAIGMGIAVGSLTVLLGVMKLFSMGGGIDNLNSMATGLIILAGAMLILSFAMKQFAGMSWEDIQKGLVGVGGSLLILAVAVKMISSDQKGLITTSIGLMGIATALLMMSGVVAVFGAMSFDSLVQGLTALMVLLAGLSVFVLATGQGKSLLTTGAGMILLATGIGMLVASTVILGLIPFPILLQGLSMLGIMLAGLAVAVLVMQGSLGGAAAVLAIAVAINMLVPPLILLGLIPAEVIAQGLMAIGAAMAIFVISAALMTPVQAAGILAVAGALLLLSVGIAILGGMSIESIGIALLALGGAFLILGVAAAVIGPMAPLLIMLAAGLTVISAALMIAAAAFVIFGIGLAGIGLGATGAAAGLYVLGNAMVLLAPHAGQIAIMAGALVLLGAAMVIAGAGTLILGAGLVVLGVGLTLTAAAAGPGVIGLIALTDAIGKMIFQAPQLGIMAGIFLALGVAMTAMGVGAALLAVGAVAVSIGIFALSEAVPRAERGIKALGAALGEAASNGKALEFAQALGVIVSAIAPLVAAMFLGVGGILALAGALVAVVGVGMAASSTFERLGAAASNSASAMNSAMSTMAATTQSGVGMVSSAMAQLGPIMAASANQITASSKLVTTAFTVMGVQSSAAVTTGASQISAALKPLPLMVSQTAQAVVTSSLLMVAAFRNMGVQSSAAINTSGSTIRASLNSIAVSSGSAAVAVGQAIINGMVRGMANSSAVTAAARRVANSALTAARNTLGIASPSKEFEKIGEFANEGFAKGLMGSTDDIDRAFEDMENHIAEALESTGKRVADAQAEVDKYAKNPRRYRTRLAEARRALAEAQSTHQMALTASKSLQGMMNKEQNKLKQLRTDYEDMLDQVAKAEDAYEAAVNKRDDAIKQYTDKYNQLPTIDSDDTYDTYIKDLQKLNEKTQNYYDILESLRKKGLNDKLYTELLESGVDSLPFVEDLVLAGDNAILNLNKMSDDLGTISSKMGQSAGTNLFQAGVDAAAGFLRGLQDKEGALVAAIDGLVSTIVNRLKSDLQIKSPSRVMAKLGRNTAEGLAKGLVGEIPALKRSAVNLSDKFQQEIDKEFNRMTNPLYDLFMSDPVIKPTLDLSDIEAGAAAIQAMLAVSRISPDISLKTANGVSTSVRTGREVEETVMSTGDTVTYNQYNSSPRSLNAGEIYRQTNNQLSRIRKGLA